MKTELMQVLNNSKSQNNDMGNCTFQKCNNFNATLYCNSNIVIAGNDAIVAFSRRYEVVVVIHQLNEALWKIGEDDADTESKKSNNLGQGNFKAISKRFYSGEINLILRVEYI